MGIQNVGMETEKVFESNNSKGINYRKNVSKVVNLLNSVLEGSCHLKATISYNIHMLSWAGNSRPYQF